MPGADVIVIGGGNAALCAALSAREAGADVLVVERAPAAARGGNSYFTGGLMRFPHHGAEDIMESFAELRGGESAMFDLAPYTGDDFYDDMAQTTQYRADPDLVAALVGRARETLEWLHDHGLRFTWSLGRHAHKVNGRFQFWGGAPLEVAGGGAGLVDTLFGAAESAGIRTLYETRAVDLIAGDAGQVAGVRVRGANRQVVDLDAGAVILASGGFEANREMRGQYLGANWDLAKVRGSEFNTGDGIAMALRFGAQSEGHWTGCHAVAWDANAPATGDRKMGDEFSRHSYPMGIVVNQNCQRFIDEGADFQTHTYAKYGAEILKQPGLVAYQIFDATTEHLLRGDYRGRRVSKASAQTIEELATKLELDPAALKATVDAFNAACDPGVEFSPNVLDGKATDGVTPAKTNWAVPIDSPPYLGFPVTAGITFTFGGIGIDDQGRVRSGDDGQPIPGLFAAGELVGGLFFHNYPSGTGLTSGAVFGRSAGAAAAASAALVASGVSA